MPILPYFHFFSPSPRFYGSAFSAWRGFYQNARLTHKGLSVSSDELVHAGIPEFWPGTLATKMDDSVNLSFLDLLPKPEEYQRGRTIQSIFGTK